jgi:hypothetical protein
VSVWFGTETLIAHADAAAPGERASSPELVETKTRRTRRSGSARRRRTAPDDARETG